ncbi:MAG: sulfite oxidase-like oxidoreductase [Planctomycetota bacterium]|nr:sulfite oxidase-like oxidoreductase [Planctomycetota bacterium]
MFSCEASRRDVIRGALGGLVASAIPSSSAIDIKERAFELIVRGGAPLNAETPVEGLDSYLTPMNRFFVRSHFGPPSIPTDQILRVDGLVNKPLELARDRWGRIKQATLPAVLQCSGNGRALFSPRIPGVGWEKGAVGNAEWTGFRLKDLLEMAGFSAEARHVHFLGADGPPNPKTPAFLRSLPIERALDPHTLVAYSMNGRELPRLHGGPVRLVVPGWAGNHWIKWLRTITLSAEEAPGFYQRTGYRMPRTPVPPGVNVKPEDTVPVTALNVKSLFVSPTEGHRLPPGELKIHGVAWTGAGRVARVDVSVDDGPWSLAELHGPDHEYAWRLWRFDWTPTPGRHVIRARATDSSGAVQPEKTPWNKSGYLWNGIDSVAFEVVR